MNIKLEHLFEIELLEQARCDRFGDLPFFRDNVIGFASCSISSMVWNYYLRLLLGVFLFLFFSSGFFVMFLVNTSDQPLYQDEVSSEDVFESRNWEDIEKMLHEKLKHDRKERENEWKSEFLLPVTDSAIPSLSAVAAFPPPVKTSYLLSSDFKEILSSEKISARNLTPCQI